MVSNKRDTINQLILDCVAKVLRINETTEAEIKFEINHCNGIECYGWKNGYSAAEKERGEKPDPDFCINGNTSVSYCEAIYFDSDGAEPKLRALLESLNNLEKELLIKEAK